MLISALKQLNWVDLLFIILLYRACYIAAQKGFPTEVFKLLGTITAIFLSFQYYTVISNLLYANLSFTVMPIEFLDFLLFVLLNIIVLASFSILRSAFLQLVKIDTISLLNRWGGIILGFTRGILLVSIVAFAMVISTITYVRTSTKDSYFGKTAFDIAPSVYRSIWNSVLSKFMPQETYNKNIEETRKSLNQ